MRKRDLREQRKDKRTRFLSPKDLERSSEQSMNQAFEQLAREQAEKARRPS